MVRCRGSDDRVVDVKLIGPSYTKRSINRCFVVRIRFAFVRDFPLYMLYLNVSTGTRNLRIMVWCWRLVVVDRVMTHPISLRLRFFLEGRKLCEEESPSALSVFVLTFPSHTNLFWWIYHSCFPTLANFYFGGVLFLLINLIYHGQAEAYQGVWLLLTRLRNRWIGGSNPDLSFRFMWANQRLISLRHLIRM